MNPLHRKILLALASFAMLLAGGCAATGPKFTEFQPTQAGKSELILYRPDRSKAGGRSLNVLLRGTKVAELRNAGWLKLTLEPGEHLLGLNQGAPTAMQPIEVTIALDRGQRRIYRTEPEEDRCSFPTIGKWAFGLWLFACPNTGYWSFYEVPDGRALPELRQLRQSTGNGE